MDVVLRVSSDGTSSPLAPTSGALILIGDCPCGVGKDVKLFKVVIFNELLASLLVVISNAVLVLSLLSSLSE